MNKCKNKIPEAYRAGCERLGDVIAAVRRQQRLSQEALAQKAMLSTRQLSNIETGQCNTSIITLVKLAAALQISVACLARAVDTGMYGRKTE